MISLVFIREQKLVLNIISEEMDAQKVLRMSKSTEQMGKRHERICRLSNENLFDFENLLFCSVERKVNTLSASTDFHQKLSLLKRVVPIVSQKGLPT